MSKYTCTVFSVKTFIQILKRTGEELIFSVTGDAYLYTIDKSKDHGIYGCESSLRNQIIEVICGVGT